MTEWHDYNERNIHICKTCKDLHDLHKDEEGQIEVYHPIVSIKKHNKSKKRTYRDADLNDFRNKNVKLKAKPGFHANQLDAFYAIDSESDNSLSASASKSSRESSKSNSRKSNQSSKSSSRKKKRTARDATLADLANKNVKIRTKPGPPPNSQLDWYEIADSESDNSRSKSIHRGGKNKSKKNKSKNNKKI
jgi:hypothetical protein